jgi:hypothetical protein
VRRSQGESCLDDALWKEDNFDEAGDNGAEHEMEKFFRYAPSEIPFGQITLPLVFSVATSDITCSLLCMNKATKVFHKLKLHFAPGVSFGSEP